MARRWKGGCPAADTAGQRQAGCEEAAQPGTTAQHPALQAVQTLTRLIIGRKLGAPDPAGRVHKLDVMPLPLQQVCCGLVE